MFKSETYTKCDVCGAFRKGNPNGVTCQFCGKFMLTGSRYCKCYGTFTTPRKCCGKEYERQPHKTGFIVRQYEI